jgi:kinesin family protein 14
MQGPYVVNLTKCLVTSFEEVQRWLAVGNRKRVVASTSQNKRSSRSHVIFTIMLSQSKFVEEIYKLQLYFCIFSYFI